MSLRGGLLSWHGYLCAGCDDDGDSKELVPSAASPSDGLCVTSVVPCASASSASGTSPAPDVLTNDSEGLSKALRLGILASFLHNHSLSLPPKSLKTGNGEHSSSGPREQIVFGSHSELGKCGDLSPE